MAKVIRTAQTLEPANPSQPPVARFTLEDPVTHALSTVDAPVSEANFNNPDAWIVALCNIDPDVDVCE